MNIMNTLNTKDAESCELVDVETSCVLNIWRVAIWSDKSLNYVERPERYSSKKQAVSAVLDYLNTPGCSPYLRDYRVLHSLSYYLFS